MKIGDTVSSICFTGHRDLSKDETEMIKIKLESILTKLINNKGLTVCYAGGAIGLDTAENIEIKNIGNLILIISKFLEFDVRIIIIIMYIISIQI